MDRLGALSIHDLRVCVTLSHLLSFRKTAELMGIAQPSVSASVVKVEQTLGAQLFFRNSRSCRVTAFGSDTLPTFQKALEILDGTLAGSHHDLSGNLRIGIIPTVAPFFLTALHDFLRQHFPDCSPYVAEAHTDTLLLDLASSQIDLAIISSFGPVRGIDSVPLSQEPLMLAIPNGHPLASFAAVRPDQIDPSELLLLERGNCLRDQTLRLCDLQPDVEPRLHTTSLLSLLQLVGAGQGVAMIPAMSVPFARQFSGVQIRPLAESVRREILMARRSYDPRAAVLDRFAESLKAVLQSLAS